jgi:hypothetical protein
VALGAGVVVSVELTVERLRELLHYDPYTGVFKHRSARAWYAAGAIAGRSGNGRNCDVSVDGKRYAAHRLAWLYVYGKWPDQEIDHIDCNPRNNRISNLRDVSREINTQNQRVAHANNTTSGLLGVSLNKRSGLYRARIVVNKRAHSLGYFKTAELAHEAYVRAKRTMHKGNTL